MQRHALRPRRSPARKSSAARHRALRAEPLEPRMLLSASALWGLYNPLSAQGATNMAPTVAKAVTVNANSPITGKTASLSVLGNDDGGETKLVYRWSVTAAPSGGAATFSANNTNAAKNCTVSFSKAGTYTLSAQIVDASGLSVVSKANAVVTSSLASIRVTTSTGQVITPGSPLSVAATNQAVAAQGIDQFGVVLAAQPSFTWSMSTIPSGAPAPTVSASGSSATVTFRKAGSYGLTVQARPATGAALSSVVSMNVVQVATSLSSTPATTTVNVSGTSVQLTAISARDQFGNTLTSAPTLTWTASCMPLNAAAPTFAASGSVTTVTFKAWGGYTLNARYANSSLSYNTSVYVNQVLASIVVSPKTPSILQGATQQFTAQALDQFSQAMANQQVFTWSTTGGTISSSGLLTAPTNVTSVTVTAKSGTIAGQTAVTLLANSGKIQNAALASLVKSLDADGSINRADMIRILQSVGADNVVDAIEFSDLKQVLCQASTLKIPDYVQALAGDVVNGSLANASYQGQALGNLVAGSSGTQLTRLINKWFYGSDHPALCNTSLVYTSTAGTLFPSTPSHLDEFQGSLGDCYLISALGTLADSNPTAVKNAIIDNSDGTFTVRFYTGKYGTIYNYSDGSIGAGFSDNIGTADYVTVDRYLPASTSGTLAYADYGAKCTNSANSLWIPLIEKAYAQWNETGKEGRDGTNSYASIQGGWMATVDAQILGYNAIDYIMTSTKEQVAINALAAKKAVTIGTLSWSGTMYGLYPTHAYAITGYNASTDTFTLYNPWGSNQPGQLTWSQLQATCTQLAVADTTGSVSFGGVAVKSAAARVSLFAERSPSVGAAASFESSDAAAWVCAVARAAASAGSAHAALGTWPESPVPAHNATGPDWSDPLLTAGCVDQVLGQV